MYKRVNINDLSARNLVRYGMRRGAYDGGNGRRFVLFTTHDTSSNYTRCHEFDTKCERDDYARGVLADMWEDLLAREFDVYGATCRTIGRDPRVRVGFRAWVREES